MSKLLLYPHQGMGDMIICLGIIKHLCEKHGSIAMLAKLPYLDSLRVMCKGLDVELIPSKGRWEAKEQIEEWGRENVLGLGFWGKAYWKGQRVGPGAKFDLGFYNQAGLDFDESWNVDIPDGENMHKPPRTPYAFVHDDLKRGLPIEDSLVGLPQYRPRKDGGTIFDYCDVIRGAEEIHCIDSCFALMIDRMEGVEGKKFLHHYVKPNGLKPEWRNGWEILNDRG